MDNLVNSAVNSLQIGMHWFPEQPGGLDRIFHSLVQSLPGAGVAVRGMVAGSARAAQDSAGAVQAFAPAGMALGARLLAARRMVRTLVAEQQPDIVASHFALYALPAFEAVGDCARITHFHGPWAAEAQAEGGGRYGNWVKRRIEQLAYGRQTMFVVLSQAFATLLETHYGVPPERIRVVPGCADIARFAAPVSRADARAQLGLPLDRPIVLSVRRLARRMGLENLIDAMPQVIAAVPDALLVIVGRGALADELNARIAERSLQRHIQLLGGLSDELLPMAYRAADLSVVPTVALEGFGLTTIESLASGTPVLVTPVGGLPETVAGMALGTALVFEDASAAALADGITGALRGTLLLPSEEVCRAYARDGFNAALMARRVAAVYREALQQGAS